MLNYLAICENETTFRSKYDLLEKMIRPCGIPPLKEKEKDE